MDHLTLVRATLFNPPGAGHMDRDYMAPEPDAARVNEYASMMGAGHCGTELWSLPDNHRQTVGSLARRIAEQLLEDQYIILSPMMRTQVAVVQCVGLLHDGMECCGLRYELAVPLVTAQGADLLQQISKDIRWAYTRRYASHSSQLREASDMGQAVALADLMQHLASLSNHRHTALAGHPLLLPPGFRDIQESLVEIGAYLDALYGLTKYPGLQFRFYDTALALLRDLERYFQNTERVRFTLQHEQLQRQRAKLDQRRQDIRSRLPSGGERPTKRPTKRTIKPIRKASTS